MCNLPHCNKHQAAEVTLKTTIQHMKHKDKCLPTKMIMVTVLCTASAQDRVTCLDQNRPTLPQSVLFHVVETFHPLQWTDYLQSGITTKCKTRAHLRNGRRHKVWIHVSVLDKASTIHKIVIGTITFNNNKTIF
jgi:hypothetical protein